MYMIDSIVIYESHNNIAFSTAVVCLAAAIWVEAVSPHSHEHNIPFPLSYFSQSDLAT
jgi:hypothetical protein